jgi:hypothetical protein
MSSEHEDPIKDATYAEASMTAAIKRLAELSQAGSEIRSMITVLEALAKDSGPLAELMHLFSEGGEWLTGFEDNSADEASELMRDAAEYISGVRNVANIILPWLRPLAD